ncbi:MAG: hypothetical protein ACFFCM_20725 [Promethearchaeota archaeon]
MSEVEINNIWWKLEDSWKKIAKLLRFVFLPIIGVIAVLFLALYLIFSPFRSSVDKSTLMTLYYIVLLSILLIIFVGFTPNYIILANDIGNAIKLRKIEKSLPEDPEYKNIFRYYLYYLIIPFNGPLYWSKLINKIMKYLGTLKEIPKDIEYVKNRGKKFGILGTILLVSFYPSYIFYHLMMISIARHLIIFTPELVSFIAIFFSILGCTLLILGIIMVAIQIGVINRLTKSIHESGLY